MTESQYLSSTDPAAMRTLLVERGLWTEKKCRAFVEACRWEWDRINMFREGRWGQLTHVLSNAEWWNDETGHDLDRAFRAALIRDIWGNPWRKYVIGHAGSPGEAAAVMPGYDNVEINPDWLTYRNGNVVKLAKAVVTRECPQCKPGKLHTVPTGITGFDKWESWLDCSKCKATGTIPITGPIDPFRLAVLADALEEAGCTDDGILGHLRTTSEKWETSHDFSAGSMCRECGMTYTEHMSRKFGDDRCVRTRPVSHIWTPSGGCWVIDMLLAAQREPQLERHAGGDGTRLRPDVQPQQAEGQGTRGAAAGVGLGRVLDQLNQGPSGP